MSNATELNRMPTHADPLKRVARWLAMALVALIPATTALSQESERFLRFSTPDGDSYGVVRDDGVHELAGPPFETSQTTGRVLDIAELELLPPTDAGKVFAVGMNFASHISSRSDAPPPLFLKLPTSLIGHEAPVTVPEDAGNLHFEGELVLVIGKEAKNISEQKAADVIFGVTAGNDITERSWQGSDLQWMRAKASDGFGPVGPYLVTGLDPNDVVITTRLNDEIVQQESTANMIHKPAKVVSYLSRYFTLKPGDMIFMGTPGRTRAMKDGDIVTVTVDGVGTLSNQVVWSDEE